MLYCVCAVRRLPGGGRHALHRGESTGTEVSGNAVQKMSVGRPRVVLVKRAPPTNTRLLCFYSNSLFVSGVVLALGLAVSH